MIFGIVIGIAYSIPFKKYFRKKRKKKKIPNWLTRYCKKLLIYTPMINSGLILISFSIPNIYELYIMSSRRIIKDNLENSLALKFVIISIISSVLISLFIYFWQRHRVHIKYLEFVFFQLPQLE